MDIRSVISGGRRYEIEVKPFKGHGGGFVGCLWEMNGLQRIHCTTIKYGQSESDVNNQIDQFLVSLQLQR